MCSVSCRSFYFTKSPMLQKVPCYKKSNVTKSPMLQKVPCYKRSTLHDVILQLRFMFNPCTRPTGMYCHCTKCSRYYKQESHLHVHMCARARVCVCVYDCVLLFPQIHWFSIFNSFMMVIFLIGLVSMILMRTLRKDYARYRRDEEIDDMVGSTVDTLYSKCAILCL